MYILYTVMHDLLCRKGQKNLHVPNSFTLLGSSSESYFHMPRALRALATFPHFTEIIPKSSQHVVFSMKCHANLPQLQIWERDSVGFWIFGRTFRASSENTLILMHSALEASWQFLISGCGFSTVTTQKLPTLPQPHSSPTKWASPVRYTQHKSNLEYLSTNSPILQVYGCT